MRILSYFSCLLFLSLFSCGAEEIRPEDSCSPGNENLVSFATQKLQVTEGEVEDGVLIDLVLEREAATEIRAYVSTRGVRAVEGDDYIGLDRVPVLFKVGEQTQGIRVEIIDDEHFELEEEVDIEIVAAEGADTVRATVRLSILDNDEEAPVIDIPNTGYATPLNYANRDLIWHDEFEGNEISEDWTFEIGNGDSGWGNNELEYYRKENASIVQGNYLVIEAREEPFGGYDYTSSRMITYDKFDFQYGRVDIRAALPYGQGIWPALWMLGSNIYTVGWPACGEIDIMELVGHEPSTLHGTAHWDNNGQHASYSGKTELNSGTFNDEFHVFSIEWSPFSIRWLLDDQEYHVIDINPAELSELKGESFFIFNVAVGGNWPGAPDATTVFPQRMIVDYIRVFQ